MAETPKFKASKYEKPTPLNTETAKNWINYFASLKDYPDLGVSTLSLLEILSYPDIQTLKATVQKKQSIIKLVLERTPEDRGNNNLMESLKELQTETRFLLNLEQSLNNIPDAHPAQIGSDNRPTNKGLDI